MKLRSLALLSALFLFSCGSEPEKDEMHDSQENEVEMSDADFIRRQIEGNLRIPATEVYDLKMYQENLNGDDVPDYIITVNRLQFALNEAIERGNVAKRAEIGYMGNYNYFFYMNGANRTMSAPIPVPSSPHAKLRVTFEKIRSEAYFDVMVDFRIRNSGWRRFFTILRDSPLQTFEMKCFDGLGTSAREAYSASFERGTYSLAKDILVYKADLEEMTFDDPMGVYTADPLITPSTVLDRKWFFNDNELKYFTEK